MLLLAGGIWVWLTKHDIFILGIYFTFYNNKNLRAILSKNKQENQWESKELLCFNLPNKLMFILVIEFKKNDLIL